LDFYDLIGLSIY